MKKRVSDKIVEMLQAWGVERVYGIPNDTINPLMESLVSHPKIEFILVRHEEAGSFAANMEARLNGKLGVCIAAQGPGAIHLLNGLYDALMDRVPLLAITGQVETAFVGTQMVQEINQLALFNDPCYYNAPIVNPEQVVQVLSRAYRSALMKRGPVHIVIPSDVLRLEMTDSLFEPDPPIFIGVKQPAPDSVEAVCKILKSASKPCILYGIGAVNAIPELTQLAEQLQAPLVYTSRSKEFLASDHPHLMGGLGLLGSRAANHAIHHCDVLLVLGSSFAFTEYYPREAKIIQIDTQLERIGLHAPIAMGMAADCKAALEALLLKLTPLADQTFLQECMSYKRSDRAAYDIQNKISITKHRIHPVTLFDSINRLAPEDAIFTIEVGSAIIWANNLLQVNGKQRFIWSSNLATLGFALPAGIGAKLCMKDRPSIIIAGDGSFDMLISDFITAVKYKAPIICLVLNNRALRFSGSDENLESAAHFGTQLDNPDFSALAKAMGGDGAKVQTLDELDGALEIAFKTQVPYILDIYLEPNAKPVPPLINPKMNLAFATSRFKRFFSKLHNGNNSTEHVN